MTPLVPGDAIAMALPGVWIEITATAIDGAPHDVSLYLDVDAAWTRGDGSGALAWQLVTESGASGSTQKRFRVTPAVGTEQQYVEVNDWPEWGELSLTATVEDSLSARAGAAGDVRADFAAHGALDGSVSSDFHSAASEPTAFAFAWRSSVTTPIARRAFLAHGRSSALRVDGVDCLADWTALGDLGAVSARALAGADAWRAKIEAHDDALLARARTVGGDDYAALIAFATRQGWGGNLACTVNGDERIYQKEIASGSLTSTVDVIFPTAALFLVEDPATLGLLLHGFLDHTAHHPYGEAYPPHDLGPWPLVQGDPTFMDTPVETAGDLLLLAAAHARATGDTRLIQEHRALLQSWSDYLIAATVDPPLQSSTDDFTGMLPHASVFGMKEALAVAAWAECLTLLGDSKAAASTRALASTRFTTWLALVEDSDHLGLTLDGAGWSLKYNLWPDRLLGLGLVPDDVRGREVAFYRAHQGTYGAPLDSRFSYTKADWLAWSAAMADAQSDFEALIAPIARMLARTTSTNAFPDIYDVETMIPPWGFTARPVVGGVFARLAAP